MKMIVSVMSVGLGMKKELCKRVAETNYYASNEDVWMDDGHREINGLRNICSVIRMDRMRNEDMRRRVGARWKMSDRVDRTFPKWSGHVDCMSAERLTATV